MEDRHAKEIAAGLKDVAGAISGLGLSILMAALILGNCMQTIHH